MKMNIIKYLMIFSIIILVNSCAKEELSISTELVFPEFNNIIVQNANNIVIVQGAEQSVIVTGTEDDLRTISSEVTSKSLTIDNESLNEDKTTSLHYLITIPIIKELVNESKSPIDLGDFDHEGFLNITSSSTGDIEIGQFNNVDLLNINIEGDGSIISTSSFDNLKDLNITLNNSGNYFSYSIVANNAIVSLNGSGSCYLSVKESLNVEIIGTGTVNYKGDPLVKEISYISNGVLNQIP